MINQVLANYMAWALGGNTPGLTFKSQDLMFHHAALSPSLDGPSPVLHFILSHTVKVSGRFCGPPTPRSPRHLLRPSPFIHPLRPVHPPDPIHLSSASASTNTSMSFLTSAAFLRRSAVAVHRGRVPVHPPAGHRGHPHVHRSLPFWKRHRRPQAQRLCCHFYCALW